ncbi:fucose-specific lectin [Rhexocercosporidium sp. MPI-PUGE-AT-0058]|nr:fucose-specific lectin [Rhexocercosporidium sp. MPI-PUGE-AT-0058]
MSSSTGHGPVSEIAFRTPIAALYKTSTTENVIKVFFQDVLGGIRLNSYDDGWNGGTSSFATAKLGTPLAAIGSPSLDKIRLYFLSPENMLRELCYDRGLSSGWFEGALSEKHIQVAPYSQIAAVYLPDFEIRVYAQKPDDTIQEFNIHESSEWAESANLGAALSGSSIAATAYSGSSRIGLVFQKTDLTIQGNGSNGSIWWSMDLNITNSLGRGAIAIVSYTDPANSSDFSVRMYYTASDNRIKEKIFNAGSPPGVWVDGTLNMQTIPGSNLSVIVWTSGSKVILRAYLQQGQQVSAISEWAGTTTSWGQGYPALPPATV